MSGLGQEMMVCLNLVAKTRIPNMAESENEMTLHSRNVSWKTENGNDRSVVPRIISNHGMKDQTQEDCLLGFRGCVPFHPNLRIIKPNLSPQQQSKPSNRPIRTQTQQSNIDQDDNVFSYNDYHDGLQVRRLVSAAFVHHHDCPCTRRSLLPDQPGAVL